MSIPMPAPDPSPAADSWRPARDLLFDPVLAWTEFGLDDWALSRVNWDPVYVSSFREQQLATRPVPATFDAAHLKAIHAYLFQDSPLASGVFRTSNNGKPQPIFLDHQTLDQSASRVFDRLARDEFLTGLDQKTFTERASVLLADLHKMRPFDDGNDRSIHVFVDQVAENAGWTIRWADIDTRALHAGLLQAHVTGDLATVTSILTTVTSVPPVVNRSDFPLPLTGALTPTITPTAAVAAAPVVPAVHLTR
jgi:cell filamentation protein